MAEFRLSARADADLGEIADYTIEAFGIDQARNYRDGLLACFQSLAENPRIGRDAEELAPFLRRYEHRSHVVFYQPRESGVLIVRILHGSMDMPRHFQENDC